MIDKTQNTTKIFGKLIDLVDGQSFLDHIDKEDPKVRDLLVITFKTPCTRFRLLFHILFTEKVILSPPINLLVYSFDHFC